jgi:hypothetical protein
MVAIVVVGSVSLLLPPKALGTINASQRRKILFFEIAYLKCYISF